MRYAKYSWILLGVLIVISVVDNATAADNKGWSVKKLWPDRQSNSRTTKEPIKNTFWRDSIPLWPTSAKKTNQPSLLERLSSGPRALWDRTKQLVTPSSSKSKRTSTSRSRFQSSSQFGGIFSRPKQNDRPKTVVDFIKQDRPK